MSEERCRGTEFQSYKMVSKLDNRDLKDLATRLLESGPQNTHPGSPRRIRLLFNDHYIVDTTSSIFVWEHRGYPFLYVPKKDFSKDAVLEEIEAVKRPGTDHVGFRLYRVKVGDKSTDRLVGFEGFTKAFTEINGMIRVEFGAIDQWFEEDVPILVHPKDPFKRVDTLPSTRAIKVGLNGVTLASTPYSVHLFETFLPCRYYMPMTYIDQTLLRPSDKRTQCPYKGEAEYYDVVLPPTKAGETETVFKDLVWYYTRPNLECAPVAGMACFYNEKVDVWVDGVKEVQPKTHFA